MYNPGPNELYIEQQFVEAYPNGSVTALRKKLASYSSEDIARVADAIYRFGIEALINAIK